MMLRMPWRFAASVQMPVSSSTLSSHMTTASQQRLFSNASLTAARFRMICG